VVWLPDRHADLAAFVLDRLPLREREAFEEHLRGCPRCRAESGGLRDTVRLLHAGAPVSPPAALRARTLATVAGHAQPAAAAAVVALPRHRRLRAGALAAAAAALLAIAVLLGAQLGGRETTRTVARTETVTRTVRAPDRQPGVLERRTTLAAVGGGVAKAAVRITRVGPGRIVELRSSTLPILPASEYYELWFVGPGDAPGAPNRVSAGTFHSDSRGRVVARFFAAANPRKLPVIAVTREPRDGDPAATMPDVLRSAPAPSGP
jgi:Anti-sigma-K factor rskA, C-terminal/Putative zinc-finger